MYHYVRELIRSRYPGIKGLTVHEFKEQLEYICKYYNIINASDLIASIYSGYDLPPNAVMLTFDDGYSDHYSCVFPIIDKLKIQGCFFPPAAAITQHKVLDVNKIHFVLAVTQDTSAIIREIFSLMDEFRSEYLLKDNEAYYSKFAVADRYNTAQIAFIKIMLQTVLLEEVRKKILDKLFNKFVTSDESAFSQELYMSIDQLKTMQRCGMYIGSHGYDHYWLSDLNKEKQEEEVNLSLKFLETVGSNLNDWIMCYPYGVYNESLLEILRNSGCKAGFTTEVAIADLDLRDPLTLPRLDTNDLPKKKDANRNKWSLKAENKL
jgi:peptidoglycan/xylan/chitin deacetylase (PgdA/CDA1 family)